ncbi:MAG: hypothetical protein R3300_09545 [Candidatus Promineifilaceae bacterium]|nr:hypothetical protein [Candidatus Promineifilaceae bacterium]
MMTLKQARTLFAVLLALSLLLAWALAAGPAGIQPGHPVRPPTTLDRLVLVAQVAAPLISLVGLLATTYFAYRQDRRDEARLRRRLEELPSEL